MLLGYIITHRNKRVIRSKKWRRIMAKNVQAHQNNALLLNLLLI